jgi:hypothetical protein
MTPEPPANDTPAVLTPEQRATVMSWMAKRNVAYKTAAKRCQAQLNFCLNEAEFSGLQQLAAQQRNHVRINNAAEYAKALVEACGGNLELIYHALLSLLGQIAFEKALASPDPENIKLIRELTQVLIAARREENQKVKSRFDREKWEFNTAKACALHQKEIQAVLADDSLDEDARLLAIRRELFGTNLPD